MDNKKLFCVSDLHSFYTPVKTALDEAGFQQNNPEHLLVVCGDVFDRGNETIKLYEFLSACDNKVLCKGNHETLYKQLLKKDFPDAYDFSNGTVRTFCNIAGMDPEELDLRLLVKQYYQSALQPNINYLRRKIQDAWEETRNIVAKHDITAWIYSLEWKNFFESDKYVFCHSTLPSIEYRTATEGAWEDAMWGNPFQVASHKYLKHGKTLCFGHFHTSWPRAKAGLCSEFGEDANFDPYFGDGFIALDGCIAYTGKSNVVVLEDSVLC